MDYSGSTKELWFKETFHYTRRCKSSCYNVQRRQWRSVTLK